MSQNILLRNNVTVGGTGKQPMLFAHGLGSDQTTWRYLTPALMPLYQLVLFDYVGSGQSDRAAYEPSRYATLDGYAQDILDICQTLDLTNVILVAHSVSAMIGLLAAIQQPHYFAKLIMIGPSPRYLNEAPDYVGGFEQADIDELLTLMDQNYSQWAHYLAPAMMGNPDRPRLGQELIQSFCSTDPAIMQQFARATLLSDHRLQLAKLQKPALILQSNQDLIAPHSAGEYTHQHIPASTLHYMNATGHCPHLSNPTETIALIQDYLSIPQPA